ncbi:AAA family ATPase [Bifidobacterium aesculapii]|uniref:AAA family ATPase n=1 Tax=Bifidobacterium aesculapii TaxID=1329411 RepID=UPI0006E19E83|nr:AAA family ATPase [Bifidobacterium aesculapii]
MRLIAMKFSGFGPYKGEYAIDFTALMRSRMFLIDGETGAGKTTILDCLTFALYGVISGSETDSLNAAGDGQRVRSKFLMNDRAETYVDLIFQVGDGYYEVRRTPAYDQPKTRGEGTTKRNATGKLMRLSQGIADLTRENRNDPERYFAYAEQPRHAEEVATRAREVSVEVTRLIGLNREQFSRTVMLAQGRFAMFLAAKPEDRTKLVKDLFGAQIYQNIQDELVTRRKATQNEVDQSSNRLTDTIHTAKTEASRILEQRGYDVTALELLSNPQWGLDRDDAGKLAFPARGPKEIRKTLRTTVTRVETEVEKLVRQGNNEYEQARQTLDGTRARFDTATALRQAAEQEKNDADTLTTLHGEDAKNETSRTRLSRALAAQPIIRLEQAVDALGEKQERLAEQAAELKHRLAQYPAAAELESRREQALREAAGAETARRDLEQADAHEQLIHAAEQVKREHAQAQNTLEHARSAQQESQQKLADLPSRENVDQQLQDIAEQLGAATALDTELVQARRVLDHAKKAERIACNIPKLEQRRQEAADALQAAENTVRIVEANIRQSGAAKYAAQLTDGEPCPVCGSREHPAPAVTPSSQHGIDELDELKQRVEEKREADTQAQAALRDAEHDLDTHREQAEHQSVEQAQEHIDGILARIDALDELRDRQSELRDTAAAITAADKQTQQARNELTAAEANAKAAAATMRDAERQAQPYTMASIEQERADARARLENAQQQETIAEQLKQRLDARNTLDKQLTQANAQAQAAADATTAAAGELAQALAAETRFDSIEEARQAAMSETEQNALRQSIRRHENQTSIAQAALQRSRTALRETLDHIAEHSETALKDLIGAAAYDTVQETAPDAANGATSRHHGEAADATANATDSAAVGATADMTDQSYSDETGEADETDETGTPIAYMNTGEPTALGTAIEHIDLAALDQHVCEAQERADAAGTRIGTLQAMRQNWTERSTAMLDCADAWADLTARFAPLQRMAALANADRGTLAASNGLTLITYAVTERFRDVLDRANELLNDIQGGIYELRLDDTEIRKGAGKTGLDITIFDRRTEEERNPGTLSGGETFFVSLALALALADIIQAENGGMSMDTLFVDEGFGSLSQDYLSDVMDMLRRISRTRDVGIISHVDWLKDQIAERISVSRVTPDGESRLEVIA